MFIKSKSPSKACWQEWHSFRSLSMVGRNEQTLWVGITKQGETTMGPVIDFLAEEELKVAEQFVMQVFEVKQARQCRSVMGGKDARKAHKEGKHERIAELIKDLRAKAAGAG